MTVQLAKVARYIQKNGWSDDPHPDARSVTLTEALQMLEDGRLKRIPELSAVFNARIARYLQTAGVIEPNRSGGCSRCGRKSAGILLAHATRTAISVFRRHAETGKLPDLLDKLRNLLSIPPETRIVIPYRSSQGEVRFIE